MEVSQQARVIAGRYQLESLIGEGGMANIWRARDLTLERAVAVKLLFARDERHHQRLVQQFLREARIAASVHHRNVIQIVDFGTTDEQQPFMVMELLEGESLGQRLHRKPPLSLEEIAQIASLTLRGLAAVHESGIVHRDLKPDNVFLMCDRSGMYFPKILDFGISRSAEPRSGRRSALTTREGMIVGTPEYMSPEQARGVRGIDKRTDIYSMGAILYEALSGHLPFSSENVGDLIIQIVTGTVVPACERNPKLPKILSDVVAKAMARAPDDRFQDALDMQQALLTAAELSLGTHVRRTLSDLPPILPMSTDAVSLALSDPPPAVPTISQDRLRTLEFAFDAADAEFALPLPKPPAVPDLGVLLPSAARRLRRAGLAAAVALTVAMAGGLLLSRETQSDTQGSLAARRAAPRALAPTSATIGPAPAHTSAAQAQATISVSLHNVPTAAHVFVDDQPMRGNEFSLARDGRSRVITVTAPGKAPWQAVHHASADANFDVRLVNADARGGALKQTAAQKATPAGRVPMAAHAKTRKKPPSALRTLDF